MKKRDTAVVDIDRQRVTVTLASVDVGRAVVKSCRSFARPAEVDPFDGSAVGVWIKEKLRESGTVGARVVLSLPRGDVVLKRLSIPAGAGVVAEDVVGAVRLQMSRQLSVPAESSAIDYVPMASAAPQSSDGGGLAWVTAAALPGDRLDWCRAIGRSAGIRLSRIGLRCFGAGHVLAEESLRRDGGVLGVVPTGSSVEFVVVESGQVMLARAVDIPWAADDSVELSAYADRVAVEAKRTWMSHRAGGGDGSAQVVIVLGSGPGAETVCERCSSSLEMPGVTMVPPGASTVRNEPEPTSSVAAASIGLLLEEASGRPMLDFLHPRRMPDHAARRRQFVLGGVLAAIVGIGTPVVLSQLELSSLDDELRRHREVVTRRQADVSEMMAEHARLSHMERWSDVRVDWIAHIGALSEQVPSPPEALVDGLDGLMNAQVDFTAKGGQYAGGTWSSAQTSSFTIRGRVQQRETAASLRGRLAAGEVYSVDSPTPDTGDRFSFQLFTPYATPRKPEVPEGRGDRASPRAGGRSENPPGSEGGRDATDLPVKAGGGGS